MIKSLFVFSFSILLIFSYVSAKEKEKGENYNSEKAREYNQKVEGKVSQVDLVKMGYQVYKSKCSSCHIEKMDMEKMMMIKRKVQKGGKPPFKAPPMVEVSARIKHFHPEEKDFVNFVMDYITNPSREKGLCMPMAFKMLGVMPPIGKSLTAEQKLAVATWLYRNFSAKWEDMHRGRKCRMRMQNRMRMHNN